MMGWKVTKQRALAGGAEITYTTDDGQVHQIFIGSSDYNEARVRQLIADQVATFEAVGNLTANPTGAGQ